MTTDWLNTEDPNYLVFTAVNKEGETVVLDRSGPYRDDKGTVFASKHKVESVLLANPGYTEADLSWHAEDKNGVRR